jgi:hypothetical protein
MRFGTWSAGRVYRAGSLMTVSRELSIYKMDLGEIGWVGENKICLTQDRDNWRALVNAAMNLGVL